MYVWIYDGTVRFNTPGFSRISVDGYNFKQVFWPMVLLHTKTGHPEARVIRDEVRPVFSPLNPHYTVPRFICRYSMILYYSTVLKYVVSVCMWALGS